MKATKSTYARLQQILLKQYQLTPENLLPTARLDELGVDSLGVMELLFMIEDEFKIEIPSDDLKLVTIGDVVNCIDQRLAERARPLPAEKIAA